jgi:hypothetical protein
MTREEPSTERTGELVWDFPSLMDASIYPSGMLTGCMIGQKLAIGFMSMTLPGKPPPILINNPLVNNYFERVILSVEPGQSCFGNRV